MRRRCPPRAAILLAPLVGMLALAGVTGAQTTTLVYDGDEMTLEATSGQTIRGHTSLEPGSTVTVTVRSESPTEPFLTRSEATVDEDHEFEVRVDLSTVDPGVPMEVTVERDGERLAQADARTTECEGGCEQATIDQEGDRLTLRAGPGREISGQTSLEEGTALTVRVESRSAERPFLVAKETTVSEEGTFSTYLDMSDVRPGTPHRVAVLYDGKPLNETTGEIVPCDGECHPIATDTPTPRPTIDPDELGFKPVVEVGTTETTDIPVALGEADAATLVIGSERVNYVVAATVRDGNGDNVVSVRFDAAAAGTDEPTLSVADGADELTVTDREPDLGDAIDPADYDMALYEGESTAGEPESVGALVIRESDPGPRERFGLEKGVLRVQRGDEVSLPIRLGTDDSAVVAIRSDADNYGVAAAVRDGDGDGRVVLTFNTENAGTDGATLDTASSEDELTVTDPEPSLNGPLPATAYDVSLYRGPPATGDPEAIGTLSVVAAEDLQTPALDDSGSVEGGLDLGGVGALAAGAVFAVVGVGLLLGLFRS